MILSRFITDLLDFCYPGICPFCSSACDGGGDWCSACDISLSRLMEPACGRCAMPLPRAGAPCPWCVSRGLPPYQSIIRLGLFGDPLRTGIHAAKYHRRWELAERLAGRLYRRPGVADLLHNADGILPVPLHWRRQIHRGFNQSQVVAARLAHLADRPLLRAAVRVRHTPTQTQFKSKVRRVANLHNAFALRAPERITGRRIVVVDDVMTTGATLQSLGRTLKKARPARLDALLLAVADPRPRDVRPVE